MVKMSEPLNCTVQCTVHHLNQCQDLRVLILSRIVNRHMELQTNEGHPFEERKEMGRLDIQGLSERMAKVKRFLWALNFKEI